MCVLYTGLHCSILHVTAVTLRPSLSLPGMSHKLQIVGKGDALRSKELKGDASPEVSNSVVCSASLCCTQKPSSFTTLLREATTRRRDESMVETVAVKCHLLRIQCTSSPTSSKYIANENGLLLACPGPRPLYITFIYTFAYPALSLSPSHFRMQLHYFLRLLAQFVLHPFRPFKLSGRPTSTFADPVVTSRCSTSVS